MMVERQHTQCLPRTYERQYYDDDDFISNSSISVGFMSDYSQSDVFDSNSIRSDVISSSNHLNDFRSSSSNSFYSDDTSSNVQSDDFKSNSIYSADIRLNGIKSCSLDSFYFQSDEDHDPVESEEDNISIEATSRNENEGNTSHMNYIHYNPNIKHFDVIESTQAEYVAPDIQSGNFGCIGWTKLLPGRSVDPAVTALFPYDVRCISTHGKKYKYDDIHSTDLHSVELDLESTLTSHNARVIPHDPDTENTDETGYWPSIHGSQIDCGDPSTLAEDANDYTLHPIDVSVPQESDLDRRTVSPTCDREVQRFISTSVYSHGTRECSSSQRNRRGNGITPSSVPSLRHTKGITPNTTSTVTPNTTSTVKPSSHTPPQTSNNNSSHSVTSSCISLESVATSSTSPHVSKTNNTSPHISKPNSTSPHISKPNSTSPHIRKPNSTSPHISKPSNTYLHISNASSTPPPINKSSSIATLISDSGSTRPHMNKSSSTPPYLSNASSTPSPVSNSISTPPHINRSSSTPPYISTASSTPQHNNKSSSTPPHISNASSTRPPISKSSNTPTHISNASSTSPHMNTSRSTAPHIGSSRSIPSDRMNSQTDIPSSMSPTEITSSSISQNKVSSNRTSLPRTTSKHSLDAHSNGSSDTTISYVVNSAEFEVKYFVISHSNTVSSTELHTDRKSPYAIERHTAFHVPPKAGCSIFKVCEDANSKELSYVNPYDIGSGDDGRATETVIPFCGSPNVSTPGTTEEYPVYVDYTQPFNLKHVGRQDKFNVRVITAPVASSCGEVSLCPDSGTSRDQLGHAGRSLPYRDPPRVHYSRCSGVDAVNEETHQADGETEYRDYASENVVIVKPVPVSRNESYFNGHAASDLKTPTQVLDQTKNSRSRGSDSNPSVPDEFVHHSLRPAAPRSGIRATHNQDFIDEVLARRDSLIAGHETEYNTPFNQSPNYSPIHVDTTLHATSTGNRSYLNGRVSNPRYSPVNDSPEIDPFITSSSIDQLYVECQKFIEESEDRTTLTELERNYDDTARTTVSFDREETVLDDSSQGKSVWMNTMIEQFESSRHAYSKGRASTGGLQQAATKSVLDEVYPNGRVQPDYSLNCILILPQSSLGLNNSNNSVCLDRRSLLRLVKNANSTSSGRKKRRKQHVDTVKSPPPRRAHTYVEKERMKTKIDRLDYIDSNPTATAPGVVIKKKHKHTREVILPTETVYDIRDNQSRRYNVTSTVSRIRTMMQKRTIKRRYITRISGLNRGTKLDRPFMSVDLEAGKGTFKHGRARNNVSLSESPESDRRVLPPRNREYSRCGRVSINRGLGAPGRGRGLHSVTCVGRDRTSADLVEDSQLLAVSANLARQALRTGMEQIRTELWEQMFKHNLQSAVVETQPPPIVNDYNEQSSKLAQYAVKEAVADWNLELAFHEQQSEGVIAVAGGYAGEMSAKNLGRNTRRVSTAMLDEFRGKKSWSTCSPRHRV